MPVLPSTVRGWWVRVVQSKSNQSKRMKRWNTECQELEQKCRKKVKNFNLTLDEAAIEKIKPKGMVKSTRVKRNVTNPKIMVRFAQQKFPDKITALAQRRARSWKNHDKRPGRTYAELRTLRNDFKSLLKTIEKFINTSTVEAFSDKYTFREFSIPLVDRQLADTLNEQLKPTGIVIHPSSTTISVAIRATSTESLDMTKEWQGIDRFIAAGQINQDRYVEKIKTAAEGVVESFKDAEKRDDPAASKQQATQLFVRSLQSQGIIAAQAARKKIEKIAGTTYLIKKRARVHRQVQVKRAAYSGLSATMGVVRLVATSGADAAAYYTIARSVISVTTLVLSEALNDVKSASELVSADTRQMRKTVKDVKNGLRKHIRAKERTKNTLNQILVAATGSSVSVLRQHAPRYRQNLLLFSSKLAAWRLKLASESVRIQELSEELQKKMDTWDSEVAKMDETSQKVAIETASKELEKLKKKLETEWRAVERQMKSQDNRYRTIFADQEDVLADYEKLTSPWFKPTIDKGVNKMDGLSALYRATLVYDTSAAINGTRNIATLTTQGLGALGVLMGF